MNQSDIRGLVCYQQARADIDILRREHIAPIVPAPVSIFPLFIFQVSKNLASVGGCLKRSNSFAEGDSFFYHATFLLFLAWYSLKTDHINPANSLAIATVALHGIFPL